MVTYNITAYYFLFTGQEWAEWGVTQLQLATIDFNNAPSQEMLWKGVGFIEKMDKKKNSVYVHCKAGRGRSTTLVACYLMKVEATLNEILNNITCWMSEDAWTSQLPIYAY